MSYCTFNTPSFAKSSFSVIISGFVSIVSCSAVNAIDVPFFINDVGIAKNSELWTVGTSYLGESSQNLGNTIGAMRFGGVQEYALTEEGGLSEAAKQEIDGYIDKLNQLNARNFSLDPDNYQEIKTVTIMSSSAKKKVNPYYVADNGENIIPWRWRNMFRAYVHYLEDVHQLTVKFIEPGNETDYGDKYKNKSNWTQLHRYIKNDAYLSAYPIVGPSTLSAGAVHNWWPYVENVTDIAATHVINGSMSRYIQFLTESRNKGYPYFASENHSLAEMIICANYANCWGGLWWRTSRDKGIWSKVSQTGRQLAYVEDRPNWTVATVYKQNGDIWLFASGGTRATNNNASPTTYTFVADRDVFFDGVGPQRTFEVNVSKDSTYAIKVTW